MHSRILTASSHAPARCSHPPGHQPQVITMGPMMGLALLRAVNPKVSVQPHHATHGASRAVVSGRALVLALQAPVRPARCPDVLMLARAGITFCTAHGPQAQKACLQAA